MVLQIVNIGRQATEVRVATAFVNLLWARGGKNRSAHLTCDNQVKSAMALPTHTTIRSLPSGLHTGSRAANRFRMEQGPAYSLNISAAFNAQIQSARVPFNGMACPKLTNIERACY